MTATSDEVRDYFLKQGMTYDMAYDMARGWERDQLRRKEFKRLQRGPRVSTRTPHPGARATHPTPPGT